MPARKYSATMDPELFNEIQEAAREDGMSLSAWLAEARRRLDNPLKPSEIMAEVERRKSGRRVGRVKAAPSRDPSLTIDAGALIALGRNDRKLWATLREAPAKRSPVIPAPVITQVWRSPRQVNLARAMKKCVVEAVDHDLARAAGELCAATCTTDAVDAIVVACAARRGDTVVTSDTTDIGRLADHVVGVEVLSTS